MYRGLVYDGTFLNGGHAAWNELVPFLMVEMTYRKGSSVSSVLISSLDRPLNAGVLCCLMNG